MVEGLHQVEHLVRQIGEDFVLGCRLFPLRSTSRTKCPFSAQAGFSLFRPFDFPALFGATITTADSGWVRAALMASMEMYARLLTNGNCSWIWSVEWL
jgi:hypothetical protein